MKYSRVKFAPNQKYIFKTHIRNYNFPTATRRMIKVHKIIPKNINAYCKFNIGNTILEAFKKVIPFQ